MGKKEDYFKWYRENAKKLSRNEKKKAEAIIVKYRDYHDTYEDMIRNTPGLDQKVWRCVLDQMDWEDALFALSKYDTKKYYISLESYYKNHPNTSVHYDTYTTDLYVCRTYHTPYRDVDMAGYQFDPCSEKFLASKTVEFFEGIRKGFEYQVTHSEDEIGDLYESGEWTKRFREYAKWETEREVRKGMLPSSRLDEFKDLPSMFDMCNMDDFL